MTTVILVAGGVLALVYGAMVLMVIRGMRKVPPGQALLVLTYNRGPKVLFSGQVIVYPKINQAHPVDLAQREFVVERSGRQGLVCKDGTRFSVKLVVRVRLERTQEDVLAAFEQLGREQLADPGVAERLFRSPAEEALRAVLGEFDHEDVPRRIEEIRDRVQQQLGARAGFRVVECVLEDIRPVPAGQLDPNDVFDAQTLLRLAKLRQAALS